MKQYLELQRKNMVEGQVLPNKVTGTALLQAMLSLPREDFLPPHLASVAYADVTLDLGHGRHMLSPMTLARLIEAAAVEPTDHILDIGCGTGYSSAILGCMGEVVTGLEQDKAMAAAGVHMLGQLDIQNAHVIHQGDWHQGYAKKAPYDVVLINGAVAAVPGKIFSQLADGGRVATVIAHDSRMGTAILITRKGDTYETQYLFDAATPFLSGFENKKGFTFQ